MTIMVRVLKEHGNNYAPRFRKEVGSEYGVPEDGAKSLIAMGLVEVSEQPEEPALEELAQEEPPKPSRHRSRK
jgi:hypothetical protein